MTRVRVRIDTPRFGFVKRDDAGRVDFVSPLPCPFAYGSIPGSIAEDGDRRDALVIGASPRRGEVVEGAVVGRIRFVDGGVDDDKLVVAIAEPTRFDRLLVRSFFTLYAPMKRALHRLRRDPPGATEYRGWVEP